MCWGNPGIVTLVPSPSNIVQLALPCVTRLSPRLPPPPPPPPQKKKKKKKKKPPPISSTAGVKLTLMLMYAIAQDFVSVSVALVVHSLLTFVERSPARSCLTLFVLRHIRTHFRCPTKSLDAVIRLIRLFGRIMPCTIGR